MSEIPSWHIAGDWFDNCSCAVACPCTFAQPPDNGYCDSVLFCHIREGHFGDINLDGLSFVRVGRWEGNLWAGQVKGTAGIFLTNVPTTAELCLRLIREYRDAMAEAAGDFSRAA